MKHKQQLPIQVSVIHDQDPKVFQEELNRLLRDLAGKVLDICPITPLHGGFGAYVSHFPKTEQSTEVSSIDHGEKSRL